jgi:glycosyltransferase involved in cell wall biosynthesis
MHVREMYPAYPVLWPLLRWRLSRADRLACVSQAVACQFNDSKRALVIYDGVPRHIERADRHAARSSLGLDSDRFVVALLGRVSDWKGQDVLARALAEPALAEIGAVGLIAGDPWRGAAGEMLRLEQLHTELDLGDRLRGLGFLDDVGTILGAADAVAVPSTRPDPFPNSALEAAAAGVPVVAAAHGGLPEMLRDGETGLLVEPGDPVALAEALRDLADDRERSRRIGAAASADVAERFPPERMLERIQQIYDELTGAARDRDAAGNGKHP